MPLLKNGNDIEIYAHEKRKRKKKRELTSGE